MIQSLEHRMQRLRVSVDLPVRAIPVALTESPNNSRKYEDMEFHCLDGKVKYYFDDQRYDAGYIQLGAHFFKRTKLDTPYVFEGLVKEISKVYTEEIEPSTAAEQLRFEKYGYRQYVYLTLDKNTKTLFGDIECGETLPEYSPGGPGLSKYNRDCAYYAGIRPLAGAYQRGILQESVKK